MSHVRGKNHHQLIHPLRCAIVPRPTPIATALNQFCLLVGTERARLAIGRWYLTRNTPSSVVIRVGFNIKIAARDPVRAGADTAQCIICISFSVEVRSDDQVRTSWMKWQNDPMTYPGRLRLATKGRFDVIACCGTKGDSLFKAGVGRWDA
jgi:hypothetical protein